ncbi:MAG: hypothetical protein RLZ12_404 [Bacillota bacterium]|jgi:zinc transport system ATP-binding protein
MPRESRIIEIRNLYFAYQKELILDNVSFSLKQGDFLALVGPNGSGKSTLLKILLGLLKPLRGKVLVLGEEAKRLKQRWRIGYVSQQATAFNHGFPATIREVVTSGLYGKLGLMRTPRACDKAKVDQALDEVGLSALASETLGQVSGGLKQRAFIARALVSDPQLLILDEPTVGIDMSSTEKFYKLLGRLHQEQGLSLLLVTHDIGVVTTLVDYIACLNKKIFFHGRADNFSDLKTEILKATYGHDVQIIKHQH